ncbi:uncharacterized protein LOC123533740 [Mercenaria mercenaria]|uniref:uncharacterized protein LOC123533740 n=1 Tax=Mercenaria mercenaria TaxID=6596 RepID=UPI001E1D9E3E|nr:uncharacterized protein LOC123533740 [Mercenaria mercenaria]
MGEILQQMLGFLLITLLLANCDSFPQISDRNLRSENKKENLMIEEILGEVGNRVAAIKREKNENVFEKLGNGQITGANLKARNTLKHNLEKVFRVIRGFTEKTIANMLKYYLNNKRKHQITNIENSDVILGDSKSIQIMQTNLTTDIAVAKPSVTKYTGVSKKSENKFSVDTIKMPSPAESKVDRWLPGLRNFRRRRSFFSDLGIGLESAFENDETDVVFGAHTSPCDYADRHYCLNGGTCVFLGALEMKTCRCKIGYTGLRCEMINQEFLLALLSDEFFG